MAWECAQVTGRGVTEPGLQDQLRHSLASSLFRMLRDAAR